MSSIINFVIKQNNSYQYFDVSSGGLHHLYNPQLFNGNKEAIASFIEKTYPDNIKFGKPSKEDLLEFNYFIIMDFDNKTIYDFQPARYLQCLSLSFDTSWIHFDEWHLSNQVIKGIVDPNTLEIKIPFPENGVHIYDFFKDPKNTNPLPLLDDGELIIPDDHVFYHIAIAPEGWKFISLSKDIYQTLENKDEMETMLSKVQQYFNI